MHSVHFSLSKNDFTKAVFARITRPLQLFKWWSIWAAFVFLVYFYICITSVSEASRKLQNPTETFVITSGIRASISATCTVAAVIAITTVQARLKVKAGDGIIGDHVCTVTDDGLHERTSANETLVKWTAIASMKSTKSFHFIDLKNNTFYVIPRGSFSSIEEEERFRTAILGHIAKSV